jgi:hypothetical protein
MAHTYQPHRLLILKWTEFSDELWRIMRKVIASLLVFFTVFDGDLVHYLLILWEGLIKPTKNITVTASGQWTDPTHSVSKVSNFTPLLPPTPSPFARATLFRLVPLCHCCNNLPPQRDPLCVFSVCMWGPFVQHANVKNSYEMMSDRACLLVQGPIFENGKWYIVAFSMRSVPKNNSSNSITTSYICYLEWSNS